MSRNLGYASKTIKHEGNSGLPTSGVVIGARDEDVPLYLMAGGNKRLRIDPSGDLTVLDPITGEDLHPIEPNEPSPNLSSYVQHTGPSEFTNSIVRFGSTDGKTIKGGYSGNVIPSIGNTGVITAPTFVCKQIDGTSNTLLRIESHDSNFARAPVLDLRAYDSQGSSDLNGTIGTDKRLGTIQARAGTKVASSINTRTSQDWTAGKNGVNLVMSTIPNNSDVLKERLVIGADQKTVVKNADLVIDPNYDLYLKDKSFEENVLDLVGGQRNFDWVHIETLQSNLEGSPETSSYGYIFSVDDLGKTLVAPSELVANVQEITIDLGPDNTQTAYLVGGTSLVESVSLSGDKELQTLTTTERVRVVATAITEDSQRLAVMYAFFGTTPAGRIYTYERKDSLWSRNGPGIELFNNASSNVTKLEDVRLSDTRRHRKNIMSMSHTGEYIAFYDLANQRYEVHKRKIASDGVTVEWLRIYGSPFVDLDPDTAGCVVEEIDYTNKLGWRLHHLIGRTDKITQVWTVPNLGGGTVVGGGNTLTGGTHFGYSMDTVMASYLNVMLYAIADPVLDNSRTGRVKIGAHKYDPNEPEGSDSVEYKNLGVLTGEAPEDHFGKCVVWSHDGRRLAVASETKVYVYQITLLWDTDSEGNISNIRAEFEQIGQPLVHPIPGNTFGPDILVRFARYGSDLYISNDSSWGPTATVGEQPVSFPKGQIFVFREPRIHTQIRNMILSRSQRAMPNPTILFEDDYKVTLDGNDDFIELKNAGTYSFDSTWGVFLQLRPPISELQDSSYVTLFRSGNNAITLRKGGSNWGLYVFKDNLSVAQANTWHAPTSTSLIFVQCTGTHIQYYLDGVLRANIAINQTNATPSAHEEGVLQIGKGGEVKGQFWYGSIDNLLLLNDALDSDEVSELFGSSGPEEYTALTFYDTKVRDFVLLEEAVIAMKAVVTGTYYYVGTHGILLHSETLQPPVLASAFQDDLTTLLNGTTGFVQVSGTSIDYLDFTKSWFISLQVGTISTINDNSFTVLVRSGGHAVTLRKGGSNWGFYVFNQGVSVGQANTWHAPNEGSIIALMCDAHKIYYYLDGVQRAAVTINQTSITTQSFETGTLKFGHGEGLSSPQGSIGYWSGTLSNILLIPTTLGPDQRQTFFNSTALQYPDKAFFHEVEDLLMLDGGTVTPVLGNVSATIYV